MGIEDTHLWKDYYDGCEEEGWQDADPFDKDSQDAYDAIWDDYSMDRDEFEEDNYDPDFFDERDNDNVKVDTPPAATPRTRNIYIPIIDNPRKPRYYCPKCHSNGAIRLKYITPPPQLDSSPAVHYFYLLISLIFLLPALRSVADIVMGIDIAGNLLIIGVSGAISFFAGRAYLSNKKQHEEHCKIYQQQCDLWANGYRCTACGTHYPMQTGENDLPNK